MMPAIPVKSVTRRFGDLVAVDNLSFGVAGGVLFGLLAPNGAGKTTVINLITGMLIRDDREAGELLRAAFDEAISPVGQ